MLRLLKNKPWRSLINTLTSPIPFPLLVLFILCSILLPSMVIFNHMYGINTPIFKYILDVFSLIVVLFIPKYLRTGKKLLSLQSTRKKGFFPTIYHTVLKIGGTFVVIFFTYTAILISMIIVKILTGIEQSQEIPDMSHVTIPMIVYRSFSAGLTEEVWRIVTIVLILAMIKKISGNAWNKNTVKSFALFFAVIFTSFAFGWLHTFGYSDSYFSVPIIIQIGVIGVILSGVFLLTRRIWYAIFFHFVFDFVSMTLNAKARDVIMSDTFSPFAFIADQKIWFVILGCSFLLGLICFILSIYFLRFSKGLK